MQSDAYVNKTLNKTFWLLIMGPISHILINNFKYGSDKKDIYGTTMMLTYHSIFYAQGMLTSIWYKVLEEYL